MINHDHDDCSLCQMEKADSVKDLEFTVSVRKSLGGGSVLIVKCGDFANSIKFESSKGDISTGLKEAGRKMAKHYRSKLKKDFLEYIDSKEIIE